ncbi:UNVERIFIED_CONTAM: hypothetical protein K2H54_062602 [Gekko kuhli]
MIRVTPVYFIAESVLKTDKEFLSQTGSDLYRSLLSTGQRSTLHDSSSIPVSMWLTEHPDVLDEKDCLK